MKSKKAKVNRKGSALLVVLFIVMAITILSLGFLSRSDVELACGENMILRTQMDYLAESGLEHARGLILNNRLDSNDFSDRLYDSNDYYNVNVVKLGECNYKITCEAYREKGIEKIGRSSLEAELRLDPCIAFWTETDTTISNNIYINGDVYCKGTLTNNGTIDGDAFASGGITNEPSGGSISGQIYANGTKQIDVNWPNHLSSNDFSAEYYIGSSSYSSRIVDGNVHLSGSFVPSESNNPAGVRYHDGDINLPGDVNIVGMLVVNGTLRIGGANNVIRAVKNFPAMLVTGNLIIEDGGELDVYGLVVVSGETQISASASGVSITGGLFVGNGIVGAGSITITAAPSKTAIITWSGAGIAERWGQAGGAFFKSIGRL
jgi:hypothetical protein